MNRVLRWILAVLAAVLLVPGTAFAGGGPSPSPSASPTPTTSPEPSPGEGEPTVAPADVEVDTEAEGAESPSLSVSSRGAEPLVEVGEKVRYSVTVANPTDATVFDVSIVHVVSADLDILDVIPSSQFKAVQVGRAGSVQDIVWVLDLDPNETVQLSWVARARKSARLGTLNITRAIVDDVVVARHDAITYIAGATLGVTFNPAPTIREKLVELQVVPAGERAATAPGALPLTGADPGALTLAAVVAILFGAGLWWTARRRSRPSLVALCCCILLVSAGCTSEDPASPDASTRASDGATADAPSSGDGPDEDGADEGNGEQIAPVVKGKEVTRGGGEDAGGDPREGDGSGSEPGGPGSGSTVPTETRTVPVVSYVTRSADDLPVDSLGSRAAENLITFDWSSRDLEGQSSRLFVPQAAVDLALELTEVDDALLLTAVLTNTSADRRLAVEGRIVHELFDGVGTSLTELESPPLDIVLNPGGHTSVQFSYGLPDGSYRAEATFRPVE